MYIRMVGRERLERCVVLGWWGERDREVCILGRMDIERCVY